MLLVKIVASCRKIIILYPLLIRPFGARGLAMAISISFVLTGIVFVCLFRSDDNNVGIIRCEPVTLGHGSDRRISQQRKCRVRVSGMGKNVTLTVHPGTGHAFMGPHNALGTLNATLAAEIWPKAVSFLRETLRYQAPGH